MSHLGEIMTGVKTGVLLTTANKEKVNSMTISWGYIGFEWNKLIFANTIS
jgi:flavin reductase (DIM6/NTAB) family NADH-FMN oxidoreductase RutF